MEQNCWVDAMSNSSQLTDLACTDQPTSIWNFPVVSLYRWQTRSLLIPPWPQQICMEGHGCQNTDGTVWIWWWWAKCGPEHIAEFRRKLGCEDQRHCEDRRKPWQRSAAKQVLTSVCRGVCTKVWLSPCLVEYRQLGEAVESMESSGKVNDCPCTRLGN